MADQIKTEDVLSRYHSITDQLIRKRMTVATMESCTGGLIGVLLSDRDGASAVIPGGFFTYSNEAKIDAGVPRETIDGYGVYSRETARDMAKTIREHHHTDFGVGVTGTIGARDPANADSEPGIIYYAVAYDAPGEDDGYAVRDITINPTDRWHDRLLVADAIAGLLEKLLA